MLYEERKGAVYFDNCTVLRETDKALLILFEDANEHWIPKSCIHDDSAVYDNDENCEGRLAVVRWFAEKEQL